MRSIEWYIPCLLNLVEVGHIELPTLWRTLASPYCVTSVPHTTASSDISMLEIDFICFSLCVHLIINYFIPGKLYFSLKTKTFPRQRRVTFQSLRFRYSDSCDLHVFSAGRMSLTSFHIQHRLSRNTRRSSALQLPMPEKSFKRERPQADMITSRRVREAISELLRSCSRRNTPDIRRPCAVTSGKTTCGVISF